jgi:hypothetical protein
MGGDLETELNKVLCIQSGVFPFSVIGFVFMIKPYVCEGSHCDLSESCILGTAGRQLWPKQI